MKCIKKIIWLYFFPTKPMLCGKNPFCVRWCHPSCSFENIFTLVDYISSQLLHPEHIRVVHSHLILIFMQDDRCCSWPRKIGAISLLMVFGHLTWKQKSNKCILHICTLGATAVNWWSQMTSKCLCMCRKDGFTFHPKYLAHTALVLAGNNKIKYF